MLVTYYHLFRPCSVMKTFFFYAAVLVICMRVGWAAKAQQDPKDLADDEAEGRFILTGLGIGNTGTTSITIGNAGYIALGAALLVPLIIGLALLFYLYGGPGRDSYSSGYSGYSGSSSDSYGRNLEK